MMAFPRLLACSNACPSGCLPVRLIACLLDMLYMSYQTGMSYQFSITYQASMSYRVGMTYQFSMSYQTGMTYRTSRLLHACIHTYMHVYDIIFSAMFHVKHLYSAL